MAKNYKPRQQKQNVPLGVWKGLSSLSDHIMPLGYLSNVERFRYVQDGLKTSLGWETLDQGLDTYSYPGNTGDTDVDYNTIGNVVDYIQNEFGKIIVFEQYLLIDSDPGEVFAPATTYSKILPVGGGSEFRGCLYYAGDFIVYTDTKLYEIFPTSGVMVEETDFETDIGDEYFPVLKMFVRFGSIWGVSELDRVFWSDTLLYKVGSDAQVTDQPLDVTLIQKWQTLTYGTLASVDLVEYAHDRIWNAADCTEYSCSVAYLGDDKAYVQGDAGDFVDGDDVIVRMSHTAWSNPGYFQEAIEVDAYAQASNTLAVAATAGDTFIDIALSDFPAFSGQYGIYAKGQFITVTEGANTEQQKIINAGIVGLNYRLYINSANPLANSYTTAATVTLDNVWEITFKTNLANTYFVTGDGKATVTVTKEVYSALVEDTHYIVSLSPDSDPNAEGNIKLLNEPTVVDARAIRATYTPTTNAWTSGNAGWVDVDESKGSNVEVVESAGKQEVEGSFAIYVFKSQGDIYSVLGKPGIGGTPGSLDIEYVAGGVKARRGSAQSTNDGVIFGAIVGIEYNIYFFPYGSKWSEGLPMLNGHYKFDLDIPFDFDTYTIREFTSIIHGNTYIIQFQYILTSLIGTAMPASNGFTYSCDIFKDKETGVIDGAWLKLPDNDVEEYEEDSGNTVAAEGRPVPSGFYYHDGNLYRTYFYRSGVGYGDIAISVFYETARYGWLAGSEECKDKYYMTTDDGLGNYTTVDTTEFWKAKIATGMVYIARRINVRKLRFLIECIGGSDGDGIDVTYDIYKDLQTTSIFTASKQILDLTDETADPKFLTEVKVNFTCKYFKLEFSFDNIKYDTHPAYILLKNIAAEIVILSPEGLLPEENV